MRLKLLAVPFFLFASSWGPLYAVEAEVLYQFDGKSMGFVTASGLIKGTPREIWSVLKEYDRQERYMPRVPASLFISSEGVEAISTAGTKNAYRLEQIARRYRVGFMGQQGGSKWEGTGFGIADLPFPAEDRWAVFDLTNDETQSSRSIFKQCWQSRFGNINRDRGCWLIQPSENPAVSLVLHSREVDVAGHIPGWVARIGMYHSVKKMYDNLEKEVVSFSR